MIVYHGSNSNFKALRIAKSLVKNNTTMLNEGMGIYFSTDKEVARSYGKYIYTLEINDKYFKDFRKRAVCEAHIRYIISYVYKATDVSIYDYIPYKLIIDNMYFGGISIYNLSREIILNLDSNADWYKLSNTKMQRVYSVLRQLDKKLAVVYMFNYNIKNIGVIKKIGDDIVRIVSKENSY